MLLGQSGTFSGINLNQAFNPRGQPTTIRAWSTNGVVLDLTYCFNGAVSNFAQDCATTTPLQNSGNVARITNNLNTSRSPDAVRCP